MRLCGILVLLVPKLWCRTLSIEVVRGIWLGKLQKPLWFYSFLNLCQTNSPPFVLSTLLIWSAVTSWQSASCYPALAWCYTRCCHCPSEYKFGAQPRQNPIHLHATNSDYSSQVNYNKWSVSLLSPFTFVSICWNNYGKPCSDHCRTTIDRRWSFCLGFWDRVFAARLQVGCRFRCSSKLLDGSRSPDRSEECRRWTCFHAKLKRLVLRSRN